LNKTVTIHYILLYGYQPGQAIRRLGEEPYNLIIWTIGAHQGDLERFAVTLTTDYDFLRAEFEAHGTPLSYTREEVDVVEDTHCVANIALYGHGIWNRKAITDNPHWPEPSDYIPPFVGIGEFFDAGPVWRSWSDSEFKLLSLNSTKTDQVWSAYSGRLGDSMDTGLDGASWVCRQGPDGPPLMITDR
jgi:hypothetical protein